MPLNRHAGALLSLWRRNPNGPSWARQSIRSIAGPFKRSERSLHFAAACTYNRAVLWPKVRLLPMETRAVYPGSFDPVTNGHIDLIQRSAALFDKVVVAILRNTEKTPLFTVEERIEMLQQAIQDLKNVSVTSFAGLLVDFAEQIGASVIVRGIRAVSDYEYELQMALMNRKLAPELETVFLTPALAYTYVSSRLVREVFQHGGSVSGLVPPLVEERLKQKLNPKS